LVCAEGFGSFLGVVVARTVSPSERGKELQVRFYREAQVESSDPNQIPFTQIEAGGVQRATRTCRRREQKFAAAEEIRPQTRRHRKSSVCRHQTPPTAWMLNCPTRRRGSCVSDTNCRIPWPPTMSRRREQAQSIEQGRYLGKGKNPDPFLFWSLFTSKLHGMGIHTPEADTGRIPFQTFLVSAAPRVTAAQLERPCPPFLPGTRTDGARRNASPAARPHFPWKIQGAVGRV
jgi:hypothetical protein